MNSLLKYILLCAAILLCFICSGCTRGIAQTNTELNIYVSEDSFCRVNYPIQLYQQKYPDVKVNTTIIYGDAEDMYYEKLNSSLMTGKDIADLLIIDPVFTAHCDIYKIEQSGAFIDLNPLLAQDKNYDDSLYYTPIIKGLECDEKQYIYPIAFDLPYVLSTEENLAELGVSVETFQSMNFLEFFQMVEQKQNEFGYTVDEIVSGRVNTERHQIRNVYSNWYMPGIVDYEKQNYTFQADEVQTLIENMRVVTQGMDDRDDKSGYLFMAPSSNEAFVQEYTRDEALFWDEQAVLTCLRDINGNINAYVWLAAAIPQLSPNQQNAYDFLQILLSEEVQNFKPEILNPLAEGFAGIYTGIMRKANSMWSYGYYGGEDYAAVRHADFAYREEVSGSFLYSEWSKLIMEQAEEYYKGNCSAEQAVESVEKKLKIYVSE